MHMEKEDEEWSSWGSDEQESKPILVSSRRSKEAEKKNIDLLNNGKTKIKKNRASAGFVWDYDPLVHEVRDVNHVSMTEVGVDIPEEGTYIPASSDAIREEDGMLKSLCRIWGRGIRDCFPSLERIRTRKNKPS